MWINILTVCQKGKKEGIKVYRNSNNLHIKNDCKILNDTIITEHKNIKIGFYFIECNLSEKQKNIPFQVVFAKLYRSAKCPY